MFFDREPIANSDDLPVLYPADEFASPTRSTVPLLSLLHGTEVWRQVLVEVGMPEHQTAVHLEYTVRSPQGRGKPSHTDVMLIAGDRACAIEAKWTEPPYPTVREWLGPEPYAPNREAVLNGWLSLLQPHASRDLSFLDVENVTYQTVHRAASACAAGNSPSLAYLLFTPEPDGSPADTRHLREGLKRLAIALGSPSSFALRLIEVEVLPTSAFHRISTLPKGSRETDVMVRAALQGPPLFEFTGYCMHHLPENTFA